ncbi:MAG: tetratricopeptide repeat protein [Bacteroides sp.]|nr:tetratricopeptide repeat protein [Bacteroides sp.]
MKRMILSVLFAATVPLLSAQDVASSWQPQVEEWKQLLANDPARALEEADELLKGKNRKNVLLLTAVARACFEADRDDDARHYLELARKADAKSPAVSVLEGDMALKRRDVGQACQLYEQAIYFDPDYSEAYLKYARAYRAVSPDEAVEKLLQLKQRRPDNLEATRELAAVYYAANRFSEAVQTYSSFIDTSAATEDDLLQFAFALFLTHDFERSLQVARRGADAHPHHAAFHRLVMYNAIDLKRYAEAEEAARMLFTASDGAELSYLDHRYYGALLTARQHYDQALAQYALALQKEPARTDVWLDISRLHEQREEYPQAIDAYERYVCTLPADPPAPDHLFQLGRLCYAHGTTPDAALRRSDGTLSPDTLSAEQSAVLQRADSLFLLVAELVPDSHLGLLWHARTQSALDPETSSGKAKPHYEALIALLQDKDEPRYLPPLIEAYSYLGYYYLLQEDYPASRHYWQKILELDPDNTTANKAVEGLP